MVYNKKLDYQFCKSIVIGPTKDKERELRRVFYLLDKPQNAEEEKLLKCKRLFEKLLSSDDHLVSLKEIHKKMYGRNLTASELLLVEKALELTNDDLSYQRLAESCLFDERIAFLAFVYTIKRIRADLYPIIFYKESSELMYSYFRVGNTKAASNIFENLKKQTAFQNNRHRLARKEEVVKRILDVQDQLKEVFHIRALYLYGSCARDEMDYYSDVDLICLVSYADNERLAKEKSLVHAYFARLLDLPIDLKMGGEESDVELNANIRRDLYKVF